MRCQKQNKNTAINASRENISLFAKYTLQVKVCKQSLTYAQNIATDSEPILNKLVTDVHTDVHDDRNNSHSSVKASAK